MLGERKASGKNEDERVDVEVAGCERERGNREETREEEFEMESRTDEGREE